MTENALYQENIRLVPQMIEEIQDYAIILLDLNGTIVNWNKGAERIKGYSAEEIVGENFRRFYTQNDLDNNKPSTLLTLAKEEGRAEDTGWRVKKDSSVFWGNTVITATHNEAGELIGFIKLTRDLTKQRIAEESLRKHTKEIENKNKELEQYTYIASHDLQEPLRTVQNFIRLFESEYKGTFDEEALQYLQFINQATGRMSQLIKGLLDYSRIGQKQMVKPLDLNIILSEVLIDLGEAINKAKATVTVDKLPKLNGYETELRLLFQNLISNAIKFKDSERALEIKVAVKKTEKGYLFSVSDNGIGIEEKHLDRIFVMFQRLHSRDKYEGTGIGLTHCKKIVELHNGIIKVSSTPGEGSQFLFTLNTQKN